MDGSAAEIEFAPVPVVASLLVILA